MKKQKLSKLALWSIILPLIWAALAIFLTRPASAVIPNVFDKLILAAMLLLPIVGAIIQVKSLTKHKDKKNKTLTMIGLVLNIIAILILISLILLIISLGKTLSLL